MHPPIDDAQVRHIAKLARLKLSEAEVRQIGAELAQIVAYVAQLASVATDGVEPLSQPCPGGDVLRPDVPVEPLPQDFVLANAPEQIHSHFRVPAVLGPGDGA